MRRTARSDRVRRLDPSATTDLKGATLVVRAAGGPRLVPALLADLAATGTSVTSVEVVRPTLDDVFLALTGRSLREEGQSTDAQSDPAEPTERIDADTQQEIAA